MRNLLILKTKKELEEWRKNQLDEVTFVPTMGCLHDGHKKLIEAAKRKKKQKSRTVLVSIFVNPLQFGDNEDFEKYPRNLRQDSQIAYEAGAHAIWTPSFEDLFPGGIGAHFSIEAPKLLKSQLCGKKRNGHFDGVATIVLKLLTLIKPNYLVLGEKDWQQLIILKKLIVDLNLNIKVESVATHRDSDGLATSSRNKYLNTSERTQALTLSRELKKISNSFFKENVLNLETLKTSLMNNNLNVEYVENVDPESLKPIRDPSKLSLLAAAVHIGNTRLIDHTFLMTRSPIVAIDGPAGAGKSTVTKKFAKEIGLMYLDTGAMYRALTWMIKEKNINSSDEESIEAALKDFDLQIELTRSGDQEILVNGNNVTKEIRSPLVTKNVSIIATYLCVRQAMTSKQKEIGIKGGFVAEGRDIGTTVFPNAELKIFLTASPKERARRRALDLKKQGYPVPNLLDLEQQIDARDKLDCSRMISPLSKADDAKELKTDGMNIEEVVDIIIEMFRLRVPEEVWPTPNRQD
ncbi:bifunctional pantoate--beta-alanine ligase/(d)CMP kinase [Prochlorococcus sp. MIT 1223]|uniref:bifunctional pantoate--beta-alanine ligase/(d)CMP kinase n=1 Tax=Prochlorococcus sp. MIT 1223 TaxID=3096217 RepID=UPI002A74DB34|nr:bifunctional pantoate--beta-alanine ligase/(d)CMP kinase [Prochlorococcus sp. MIT 1223]